MRFAKLNGHARVDGQLFVQRILFALVVGEHLAQGMGNHARLVSEGLQHIGRAGGLGMWQLDQHEQSAGTLDQSAHGTCFALPFDEITISVTRKLPVFELGWAHMDAEHVGNLPSPALALAARCAPIASLAQVGDQFLAQLAHRLSVNAVSDGFV